MKQKVFSKSSMVALLTIGLSILTTAQAEGLYGQLEIASSSIDEQIDADGFILGLDDSTSAYRIALGYDWSPRVSLEAGYNDFGEVNANLDFGTVEAEADGLELGFVFRWPLSERFSLTGRAGYLWWDAETRVANLSATDSGSDPFLGIGGEFQASERVAVTLGWSRYKLDDIDVDYASLGLRFQFGAQD